MAPISSLEALKLQAQVNILGDSVTPQPSSSEDQPFRSRLYNTSKHMVTSLAGKAVDTIDSVVEVTEGIFEGVLPYVLNSSHWYVCRKITPRILALLNYSSMGVPSAVNALDIFSLEVKPLTKRDPFSQRLKDLALKIQKWLTPFFEFHITKDLFSTFLANLIKMLKEAATSFHKGIDISAILKQTLAAIKKDIDSLYNLPLRKKLLGAFHVITLFLVQLEMYGFLSPEKLGSYIEGLSVRLIVDTLLLSLTIGGSLAATTMGTKKILKAAANEKLSLKERISYLSSGIILSLLGLASLYSAALTINGLVKGLPIFHQMDAQQQAGVLKHRAIHTLGESKTCNAVFIDGISSKWGGILDDASAPSSELIFEKCHVRYYRVNSTDTFCKNLKEASDELGPLHVLAMNGHANSYGQLLNKGYFLSTPLNKEWGCINQYLNPDAQILLMGCNIATGERSLAQWISKDVLHGKPVTGIAATYYPFYSLNSFANNRFHFESLSIWQKTSSGVERLVAPFNTKTFINGTEATLV